MGRFAYFEYRGPMPPTIYSSYREPYHYVIEVERDEADKHERTAEELNRAARILIRNKLDPRVPEAIGDALPPKEIIRREFEAMKAVRVDRCTTMPGHVYEVLDSKVAIFLITTGDLNGVCAASLGIQLFPFHALNA